MATPHDYKVYTVRELLERQNYLGPAQHYGGGVTKAYDWSGAVTDQELWAPVSGNRWAASLISINASTTCTVTVYDNVDSTANRLFKGKIAANETVVIPYPVPRNSADIDRTLYLTADGAGGSITVWGWETGSGTTTTSTSTSSSSSSSSSSSISTSSSSSSSSSISSSSSSSSSSISTSSSSSSISTSSSSSSISTSSSSISSSSSSSSSVSSSSSSISQTTTG